MLTPILKSQPSIKEMNTTLKVSFNLPSEKLSVMSFLQEDNGQSLPIKINSVVKCISSRETEESDILKWLVEFKENILFLDSDCAPIVSALLKFDWYMRDNMFISAYEDLILNLVTAHSIYLRNVLKMISDNFLTISSEKENYTDEETKAVQFVHNLARRIIELIPLSQSLLTSILLEKFPYIKKPTPVILHYIQNLLTVCSYMSQKRSFLLACIIEKLIHIDALCSREDVLLAEKEKAVEMEVDQTTTDQTTLIAGMAFPLAHTLDLSMDCMFAFIKQTCFTSGEQLDWEASKKLYKELLTIFDKVILPTHGNCHVQYLMFYICSLKQDLCDGFLDYLWKKVQNHSVASGLRQMAAFYIGSFLSRAQYINISTVVACFDLMSSWIHSYIDAHTNQELNVHGTFHSVCQTVFYVFAFRSRELIEMNDGFKYLKNLNIDRMVTCRLNPLRFIDRKIAHNFASIARNYQIAYVYPVIEKNNRNMLYSGLASSSEDHSAGAMISTFFPFDPYFLKRSNLWIEPLFRAYCPTQKEAEITAPIEDEEMNACDELFSYSMSPGFKKTFPMHRTST